MFLGGNTNKHFASERQYIDNPTGKGFEETPLHSSITPRERERRFLRQDRNPDFSPQEVTLRRHPHFKYALSLSLLLVWSLPCLAQRVIVVVRHADKIDNSDDAILSPTGEVQARRLARVLKDLKISAIYTTQFRRTIQTAAPLANFLKINPFAYEQTDIDGVVKQIQQKHSTEVVMIVGHRSTVPKILQKFGAVEPVALGSSEYDSLFILTLPSGTSPTLLHLRF